ncbi:MAG: hypothetical protein WCC12_11710, partial [Anaerolineales bacterium]
MKKKISILLTFVMLAALLVLTGCGGSVTDPDLEPTTIAEVVPTEPAATAEQTEVPEVVMADTLTINIALGNNQRTITYQQATPLELPDGTVISQGALKPMWQYVSEQLGI